ncbi:cysteine peptidase family C39 domain-containing protein [Flammeovirga agarivorans]|uniref:Peptidase C39 domain-containing protein n=1 Tax=Flammeovirga agarivorans TaxID=2726742 RepID=A0A7X8XX40_9BACT|nr:cysteine peptidase family C39 domain-containing protein [Flammeovirga agarivorans]NLR92882.1 hypothetical protein [Flammeovirga agarivorans]
MKVANFTILILIIFQKINIYCSIIKLLKYLEWHKNDLSLYRIIKYLDTYKVNYKKYKIDFPEEKDIKLNAIYNTYNYGLVIIRSIKGDNITIFSTRENSNINIFINDFLFEWDGIIISLKKKNNYNKILQYVCKLRLILIQHQFQWVLSIKILSILIGIIFIFILSFTHGNGIYFKLCSLYLFIINIIALRLITSNELPLESCKNETSKKCKPVINFKIWALTYTLSFEKIALCYSLTLSIIIVINNNVDFLFFSSILVTPLLFYLLLYQIVNFKKLCIYCFTIMSFYFSISIYSFININHIYIYQNLLIYKFLVFFILYILLYAYEKNNEIKYIKKYNFNIVNNKPVLNENYLKSLSKNNKMKLILSLFCPKCAEIALSLSKKDIEKIDIFFIDNKDTFESSRVNKIMSQLFTINTEDFYNSFQEWYTHFNHTTFIKKYSKIETIKNENLDIDKFIKVNKLSYIPVVIYEDKFIDSSYSISDVLKFDNYNL